MNDDETEEAEFDGRPPRWVERDVMRDARPVAEALLKIERADWAALKLDPELERLLDEWTRIERRAVVARKRLKDRLTTQVRHYDIEEIRAAMARLAEQDDADRGFEGWARRLIETGDSALDAFLEAFPGADRQQLRQLARQARKEGAPEKAGRGWHRLLEAMRRA